MTEIVKNERKVYVNICTSGPRCLANLEADSGKRTQFREQLRTNLKNSGLDLKKVQIVKTSCLGICNRDCAAMRIFTESRKKPITSYAVTAYREEGENKILDAQIALQESHKLILEHLTEVEKGRGFPLFRIFNRSWGRN